MLPPPFILLIAAWAYRGPVPPLIATFKYHSNLAHGRVLTHTLAQTLAKSYRHGEWPSLLIPTPLHTARLRQRGFNQALEIARWLGKDLDIPVARHLLRRQRKTDQQAGLSARQRQQNLRRAFTVQPGTTQLENRTIALVDDVVTTGATVTEMTQTLLRAGAREVHVWALARTCL